MVDAAFAVEVEDFLALAMADKAPSDGTVATRRAAAARVVATLYVGKQRADALAVLDAIEPKRATVVRDFVNGDKLA